MRKSHDPPRAAPRTWPSASTTPWAAAPAAAHTGRKTLSVERPHLADGDNGEGVVVCRFPKRVFQSVLSFLPAACTDRPARSTGPRTHPHRGVRGQPVTLS